MELQKNSTGGVRRHCSKTHGEKRREAGEECAAQQHSEVEKPANANFGAQWKNAEWDGWTDGTHEAQEFAARTCSARSRAHTHEHEHEESRSERRENDNGGRNSVH